MPKFTQGFTRGLTLFDWSIGHTRLPLLPKCCPLCLKLIDPCPFRNFFLQVAKKYPVEKGVPQDMSLKIMF